MPLVYITIEVIVLSTVQTHPKPNFFQRSRQAVKLESMAILISLYSCQNQPMLLTLMYCLQDFEVVINSLIWEAVWG